jgi:hypothetical protein
MIIFDAAATDPHDIIIIGANNTIYGGNIILYGNYVSEIIMLCIFIYLGKVNLAHIQQVMGLVSWRRVGGPHIPNNQP